MKKYDEIKDIITNQLGIKDLQAYYEYRKTFHSQPITPEAVELLSPDTVDNYDFWRVVEDLFGIDPVCNTLHGKLSNSITDGNRRNLALAKITGCLNIIDAASLDAKKHKILEIGPGYGSLQGYITSSPFHVWSGIDVYPKIPGAQKTKPDGCMTDEQKALDNITLIFCSNVWQHLSVRQREKYMEDSHAILSRTSGLFILSSLIEDNIVPGDRPNRLSPTGRHALLHYGQITDIPTGEDISEMAKKYNFYTVQYTSHYSTDGMRIVTHTLFPLKKPEPVVVEPVATDTEAKKA